MPDRVGSQQSPGCNVDDSAQSNFVNQAELPRTRKKGGRTDQGRLHAVRDSVLSRGLLETLCQYGENRRALRRMEAELRADLRPTGPLGNLLFGRFWSCVLRLILVSRLENVGLMTKAVSSGKGIEIPSLQEGSVPILVTSYEDDEVPGAPTSIWFHRLALIARYDRSASREMYRTLGFLLVMRDGGRTPEILEPCVLRGVRELPRVSSGTYVAAVDPAFRSSNFGFAVLHRSDDGAITVVHTARWSGTKAVPLNLELISAQVNEILRRYDLNVLVGDQYCFPVLQQCFAKLGLQYREFAFTLHTRASLYGNLRLLMTEQKIKFVDQPELFHELMDLEEVRAPNGNIDIRPPRSGKYDIAI